MIGPAILLEQIIPSFAAELCVKIDYHVRAQEEYERKQEEEAENLLCERMSFYNELLLHKVNKYEFYESHNVYYCEQKLNHSHCQLCPKIWDLAEKDADAKFERRWARHLFYKNNTQPIPNMQRM